MIFLPPLDIFSFDFSSMEFRKQVVDGARNPPTFVVELTRRAPALMMRSITMLLPFHNYDAYPLRSMLAEIISTLLVAEKDVEVRCRRANSVLPGALNPRIFTVLD